MKKQSFHLGAFAIGNAYGIDPETTIEQMIQENLDENLDAMMAGFENGRREYANLNEEYFVVFVPERSQGEVNFFCSFEPNVKADD